MRPGRGMLVVVTLAALTVGGCVDRPATHHRPGTDHRVGTAAPASGDGPIVVAVEVRDGRPDPPAGWVDVPRGRTVRVTVTSDVADEVRVEGYDAVSARLRPRTAQPLELTADRTGVFAVTNGAGTTLVQLAVR